MSDICPQKKTTISVFRADGSMHFGGYGTMTEVPDPDGSIEHLFALMDGERTVEQIHVELVRKFPAVTFGEMQEALGEFDEAGFLENGNLAPKRLFSERELARYERNIHFLGSFAGLGGDKYELQHRLKSARVLLLGLGGIGSQLLLNLAAMGVEDIRIVESDWVKLDDSLGAVNSLGDALLATGDRDFVFNVGDRPDRAVGFLVNQACVERRIPLVVGGLETQRAIYYTVLPGRSGCVRCWHASSLEADPLSVRLAEERSRAGLGGDNAAFVSLVSVLAGFMASEFVRMITGIGEATAAGRVMQVDFATMETSEAERWERRGDCAVCGDA